VTLGMTVYCIASLHPPAVLSDTTKGTHAAYVRYTTQTCSQYL